MKAVVMDLLRQYLKVEIQFQNGEEQQLHTVLLVNCCDLSLYERATWFELSSCSPCVSGEVQLLILSMWWSSVINVNINVPLCTTNQRLYVLA